MDLESLKIKIARSENLPVLPQIVSQVIKLADDPEASPKSMERLIERDAAVTAKVLRVANSPFYGQGNVTSIARAISVLGMNAIRSLVVGIAYQQMIGGRQTSTEFCKLQFWQYSLAVGTCARILAKIKSPAQSEELYCAGMMHDVGYLVLDRFMPSALDQAVKMSRDQKMPLPMAEQMLFGFDHTVVGGLLAERWGLEGMLKAAIIYHHEPLGDNEYQSTTSLIHVSTVLAQQCGLMNNSGGAPADISPMVATQLAISDEQYEIIRNVLVNEVLRAQEAYQIK